MVIISKVVEERKRWNKVREGINSISKKVGIVMKIMKKSVKELSA